MKLNVKKIILVVLMGAMFACESDKYENVFGIEPEQRKKEYFEQLQTTLAKSGNAWNMQYFPTKDSPGYNIYASFNNSGEVILGAKTVYTDNIYKEYTSRYNLTIENGPVLVFNTYNQALHPFCNPDLDPSTLADFEFIIFGLQDDSIRLRGKWMATDIRMNRLPAGMTGEEYVRRTEETKKFLFARGVPDFRLEAEGKTYLISDGYTSIFQIKETGVDTVLTFPYIASIDGFRLYKPMEIGTMKIQSFRVNEDKSKLICTDAGANATIVPTSTDASGFFINSQSLDFSNLWRVDKNNLGGVFADAYQQIVDNCRSKYKEEFDSFFFIYKPMRQSLTLSFKSGKYEGTYNIGIAPKEGANNQLVFTNKNAADGNGNVYLNNIPGFASFLNELCKDSYTISTDYPLSMTSVRLVSATNPDNWFKLSFNP